MAMHTHIKLPKEVDIDSLINHLNKQHNIILDSSHRNYLSGFYNEKILKINVSNVENHKIENGIKKISDELESHRHNYF